MENWAAIWASVWPRATRVTRSRSQGEFSRTGRRGSWRSRGGEQADELGGGGQGHGGAALYGFLSLGGPLRVPGPPLGSRWRCAFWGASGDCRAARARRAQPPLQRD